MRLVSLPASCWPPAGYRVLVASTADRGQGTLTRRALESDWALRVARVESGGWRWDTETGKGQALLYVVHCHHCIFRGVLNTRILNVVNTIKVVIIKDLLITVSFTYKIDLSITATILCITEGCTKRNQPKSYYTFINCIVLYSLSHWVTFMPWKWQI